MFVNLSCFQHCVHSHRFITHSKLSSKYTLCTFRIGTPRTVHKSSHWDTIHWKLWVFSFSSSGHPFLELVSPFLPIHLYRSVISILLLSSAVARHKRRNTYKILRELNTSDHKQIYIHFHERKGTAASLFLFIQQQRHNLNTVRSDIPQRSVM